MLSFFAPKIAEDIGPLILLIFFGMLVFGFFYVWFFIPETKGLSLEEVDEMYRSGVKPWNSAGWRPTLLDSVHHHGDQGRKVSPVDDEKRQHDDMRESA